jgi:hypothetical protein
MARHRTWRDTSQAYSIGPAMAVCAVTVSGSQNFRSSVFQILHPRCAIRKPADESDGTSTASWRDTPQNVAILPANTACWYRLVGSCSECRGDVARLIESETKGAGGVSALTEHPQTRFSFVDGVLRVVTCSANAETYPGPTGSVSPANRPRHRSRKGHAQNVAILPANSVRNIGL